MEDYIGKICPFCKTEIKEGDAVKVCPSCEIPHHEACWEENKGCTTFGCSEQHNEEQHTDPTNVCAKCGAPLEDGQDFCPKCGALVSDKPTELNLEQYIGKICPFCKTEIKKGDAVKVCPSCDIPHHEACWEENKGCTTFGCSEQHYEEQHTNPTEVCTNCGAPLGDGQDFCPKCGTPKKAEKEKKNICSKCGTELQEGQAFCPKCGQKSDLALNTDVNNAINKFNDSVDKKKKKSKVVPIVIVAAVLVAIVGGIIAFVTIQQKNKEVAISNYISTAKYFYSATLDAGGKMETIGNKIKSNWYTYIFDNGYYYKTFDSIEDAVYSAQKDQSSNISSVETKKSSIESMYSILSKVPDGSDLGDVKSAVSDAYDAFIDMYDCVMDVDGNYSNFTSEFSDTDSDLSKALSKLDSALKSH